MYGPNERTCYVTMPFGKKQSPEGRIMDFDRVYLTGIRPAIDAAGLTPVRSDAMPTSGSIQKAIIELLIRADVVVADVTLANANVLYEVGIRFGVSRGVTILVCEEGSQLPWDVSSLVVLPYPADHDGPWEPFVERLSSSIRRGLDNAETSSPVYTFFPTMTVEPPPELASPTAQSTASAYRRADVNKLRARLLEARQVFDKDALKEIEAKLLEVGNPDLLTDLMLAYRDCSAWDAVVDLVQLFPSELRDQSLIQHQYALALNRLGRWQEAETTLHALIDREGGTSETYGLLGRIYKDQWFRTEREEFRDRAIDAYRTGFNTDRSDYYPGINLLTLLSGKDDEDSRRESAALLPKLRTLIEEILATGRYEYWDVATGLELAVLAGDWSAAEALVPEARARAKADWMVKSTTRNLELAGQRMVRPSEKRRLDAVIQGLE